MRPDKRKNFSKQKGFTLFEMVVTICAIVFLYMVAAQRLSELPAAAERANFFGMLQQIKTAVNLEMISLMADGNMGAVQKLESKNPMLLMLEPPGSYRGELEEVTDYPIRRGSWYFEASSNELVYVVGERSINDDFVTIATIPVNFGQIRFRLENVYRNEAGYEASEIGVSANSGQGDWQGIILRPVHDYTWEVRSEAPVKLENY